MAVVITEDEQKLVCERLTDDLERLSNPTFQGHANIRRVCHCRKLSLEYLFIAF